MCSAHFAKPLNNGIVTATVKSTAEETKRRRRFLLWPKLFNDNFEYVADCKLLAPEDVVKQVLDGEDERSEWESVTHDIKSAFFQHEIPAAFQKCCVFRTSSGSFVFLVLPMGATVSPEIQQRISLFLARIAKVKLADKSVEKINRITLHQSPMQVEAYLSVMGKLLFAAAVLALPLFDFYYAIKQYRRVSTHLAAGRLQLTSTVTMWTAATQPRSTSTANANFRTSLVSRSNVNFFSLDILSASTAPSTGFWPLPAPLPHTNRSSHRSSVAFPIRSTNGASSLWIAKAGVSWREQQQSPTRKSFSTSSLSRAAIAGPRFRASLIVCSSSSSKIFQRHSSHRRHLPIFSSPEASATNY